MKYRYWFATLRGTSSQEKKKLIEKFGNEEEIYRIPESVWKKTEMVSAKTKEQIIAGKKNHEWQVSFETFQKQGIKLICWKNSEYPKKLRNIYDAPYCLYIKGSLPQTEEKLVAIVGARGCSAYGQAVAKNIGKQLALSGIGVVSGLAYGIDAAAHIGAIEGNGRTYGILGCGIDVCYPASNRKLYQQVEEFGGVISEYGMGHPPDRYLFPKRNRIISGLSDAVIVVEAKKRSGSLITADCALEQGKAVYAVPGRITDELSYGTNWLLSQGASPFCSVEEFLKDMWNMESERTIHRNFIEFILEKNEKLVYSDLNFTAKNLETIMEETGLDFQEVITSLYSLVDSGYVKEIYKNYFVRTVF